MAEPKCKTCYDDGWVVAEDHVSRELCPDCNQPPRKLPTDDDAGQKIAMKAYKIKMRNRASAMR